MFFNKKLRSLVYQGKQYLLEDLFRQIFKNVQDEYTEENYYSNVYYMQYILLQSFDLEKCDLNVIERGLKEELREYFDGKTNNIDYQQKFEDLEKMLIGQKIASQEQIEELILAAETIRKLS